MVWIFDVLIVCFWKPHCLSDWHIGFVFPVLACNSRACDSLLFENKFVWVTKGLCLFVDCWFAIPVPVNNCFTTLSASPWLHAFSVKVRLTREMYKYCCPFTLGCMLVIPTHLWSDIKGRCASLWLWNCIWRRHTPKYYTQQETSANPQYMWQSANILTGQVRSKGPDAPHTSK